VKVDNGLGIGVVAAVGAGQSCPVAVNPERLGKGIAAGEEVSLADEGVIED